MLRVFSSEWFDDVDGLLADLPPLSATHARIHFDAGRGSFHLELGDGRTAQLQRGEVERPDMELRFSIEDAERIWQGQLRGDDAMRAATVVAQTPGGTYSGPPAPDDLLRRPELDALPSIPGASALVAYTFSGGPFGVVHHWLRFVDGKLKGSGFGEVDGPDVRIGTTYRAIPLVRSGESTILEAIEGGMIEGELGPLGLIAGIMESPEFRAAELATGRHGFALAVLGELWSHPAWVAGLERLAREAEPS